mmetsp:Transcript_18135/g.39541  ORF Transcript_18135/g.39541 Transcript_18135/m.39541 type:complete len:345 (-) Transcript_18135:82-1116(-)
MMKFDRSHKGTLIGTFFWCLSFLHYNKELQSVDGFNIVHWNYVRQSKQVPVAPANFRNSSTIRIRRSGRLRSSLLSRKNDSTNDVNAGYSAVTVAVTPISSSLNPIEVWCTTHMNVLYDKSLSLKCPFFRRRTTDFLDGLDMVMRFLIIRHKSLPLIGPPPGCRSTIATSTKHKNLELEQLVETIRHDWKPDKQHKGYYITGRLNTKIYRDDCWFDGPDPDMPVRGVRKYLNAASQLFDTSESTAELLSIEIGKSECKSCETKTKSTIVAHWKLQGVLHLPWHPSLPTWTGRTIYHLDEEHMIYRHEEHWDISVLQAFTQTLWPEVGNVLWKTRSTTKTGRHLR